MNGASLSSVPDERSADLLAHKFRPDCADRFKCNTEQALRLRQWIQEFTSQSNKISRSPSHSDFEESSSGSERSQFVQVASKCALLTGPPGVGKTSLVYTIANELKLHVVESHSSEKRDSKLFSMLKLTNQKGKINPIAKLFQNAQQSQQQKPHQNGRRKRRKLAESSVVNQPQCLSLSGDTSIILFDDIDVVFEEDGPFLKSLVEFIKETKRPVVLTATQSIETIKKALNECEHIHLYRPLVEDCAKLLKSICKQEKYLKLNKSKGCWTIADHYNCDIRQCLNRIQFYGSQADQILGTNNLDENYILPDMAGLKLEAESSIECDNKNLLDCYTINSLVDIMDKKYNFINRATQLEHWLNGQPSIRSEEHVFSHDLGEQIKESIVELAKSLRSNELVTEDNLYEMKRNSAKIREEVFNTSHLMNGKIESRVEPPEKEFFVDIVPLFAEMINLEVTHKRQSGQNGSINSRRTRRVMSYLDTISVYLEPENMEYITQKMLSPEKLDET